MQPSTNAIIHQKTGEIKRLGEYQYNLLSLLLEHAGEVLTRNELTTRVWKNRVMGSNSLPNAIHALRQALGDNGKQQQVIKTIPKKGYLLDLVYLDPYSPPQDAIKIPMHEQTESEAVRIDTKLAVVMTSQSAEVNEYVDRNGVSEKAAFSATIKPRRLTKKIMLLILIALIPFLCILVFIGKFPHQTAKTPFYFEKSDKYYARKNIDFVWVRSPDDLNHEENPPQQLPLSIGVTLSKINDLLVKNQARLVIRYHPTFYSLVINFNITNHCKQNFQLVMDIRHWRQYQDQLGNFLYSEIERTLDDIPPCP
jgi:DNA-binding winged helix-turn-helix (wHTH) protein